ncbi:MarR family winged helix-turn-helix transcriptional regulator [Desmospora profundinema]|uniref:DNA-binding MarR family transcriptional regulator n=1 Tax=Desmospora profundinema TaxID=1571184 RepID=A0ABU1IHX5_9BACL|nr:MarR family transcriptional regulator [Desmospora profundinema]MDR6224368.1 DNA-binding MarR family transcriptional regulator [Desmospora profundinema]
MTKDSLLALDNQLCFAVYACSREISRLYRPLLDELGLTYPQYVTLLALWEEGEVTVKELGSLLFLDSGTLTPMLKRMETAGLIRRRRSSEDERKVLIGLTEEGEALKERVRCIPETLFQKSGVPAEEFHDLLERLQGLQQQIRLLNTSNTHKE